MGPDWLTFLLKDVYVTPEAKTADANTAKIARL
jgi:hypothetical protein